jgi:hypothetical protein
MDPRLRKHIHMAPPGVSFDFNDGSAVVSAIGQRLHRREVFRERLDRQELGNGARRYALDCEGDQVCSAQVEQRRGGRPGNHVAEYAFPEIGARHIPGNPGRDGQPVGTAAFSNLL